MYCHKSDPRNHRQHSATNTTGAVNTTAETNTIINKNIFTGKTLLRKRSKLILYFILFISLQLQATGFGQISINRKNAPLESILEDVSRQAGYNFFYNDKFPKNTKPVTINVNNADINEVMSICFKDRPLTYSIPGINGAPQAQPPIDVTGRVVNEKGEPIVSTVAVKGTGIAAHTDIKGDFFLEGVEENTVLIIMAK